MVTAAQACSISRNELDELWLQDIDKKILQAAIEHANSAVLTLDKNSYEKILIELKQRKYKVVRIAENNLTVTLRVYWTN